MIVSELITKLSSVPGSSRVLVDSDWGAVDPHPLLTSAGSVLFTPFKPKGLIEL